MIDVSDGLVADLNHVAEASGVLIDIETARLPADPDLRRRPRRSGRTGCAGC